MNGGISSRFQDELTDELGEALRNDNEEEFVKLLDRDPDTINRRYQPNVGEEEPNGIRLEGIKCNTGIEINGETLREIYEHVLGEKRIPPENTSNQLLQESAYSAASPNSQLNGDIDVQKGGVPRHDMVQGN